jgi:multisubunit Na+/H+ antiporter MnhB subunit
MSPARRRFAAWGAAATAAVLAALLLRAMLDLPPPAVDLPGRVADRLATSGVSHPVTAVLLNFRGYDTLLEVAVLLAALFGILALAGARREAVPDRSSPLLQTLARLLAPLLILAAVYLLWAGGHRPGGAFQAGAVLAAAAVLLHLAGLLPAWAAPGRLLRLGLAGGFLVFLGVATATLSGGALSGGALLAYPPEWAGALILLIESGLTVSLGLILAGLFLLLSGEAA